MSELAAILIAVMGGGGLLVTIVTGVMRRRDPDVITQAAERAVAMVSADNQRLRAQVEGLVTQVDRLTTEVHALRSDLQHQLAENEQLLARLAELDPATFRRQDDQ